MYDAKTTGGGHASYRVQRFANEYLLWSVMHDTPVFTLALLRDHGADPNIIRDKNGLTALHFACHSGKQKTVELLLEHGAQPLVLTVAKQLALELALHNRHWAVADTVATAISRVAVADISAEKFVALERSLKVAEQQWNTEVEISPAAVAKGNVVVGVLAKTLMQLLTMPSDTEALHSRSKYYTLPQVVSVYVISNNIPTPDTDPLVRSVRAKEALLQVVGRGKPLRDDLISAIMRYVKRGFAKSDGLMELAMTMVEAMSVIKYERCSKGVNVKRKERLRDALIGCVDPQGTVTLCARGLDPHTKRYRAGKCGLSRLGVTFGACFVFNGFKQRVDQYEILTCNPAHLLWLPVTLGQQVPTGSIVVDENGPRRTYHARAKIKVLNEGVKSKLYKLTKGLQASNTISNKDGFVPGEAVAVDNIFTACVVPYGTAAMKHVEFEILVFQKEQKLECAALKEQRKMRRMLTIRKSQQFDATAQKNT